MKHGRQDKAEVLNGFGRRGGSRRLDGTIRNEDDLELGLTSGNLELGLNSSKLEVGLISDDLELGLTNSNFQELGLISYHAPWNEDTLKTFFWTGLDDHLLHIMPMGNSSCTLKQYVCYVLWLVCTPYPWGWSKMTMMPPPLCPLFAFQGQLLQRMPQKQCPRHAARARPRA